MLCQTPAAILAAIEEHPGRFASPFMLQLVAAGVGLPTLSNGLQAILARDEAKDFYVLFPRTPALLRRLNGRNSAIFISRVIQGVLVIGEEVEYSFEAAPC